MDRINNRSFCFEIGKKAKGPLLVKICTAVLFKIFSCYNSCICITVIFFVTFLLKYFFVIILHESQFNTKSYLFTKDKFLF